MLGAATCVQDVQPAQGVRGRGQKSSSPGGGGSLGRYLASACTAQADMPLHPPSAKMDMAGKGDPSPVSMMVLLRLC